MKVIFRQDKLMKLKIQSVEDLWHLHKVIRPGDLISASSRRKFTTESGKSERKPVFLTLKVEKVEFHKGYGVLRVLGVIISGKPEEYVSIGEHHSIDFSPGDVITIEKEWKMHELERIKEAEKSSQELLVNVLVIDEREAELFKVKLFSVESVGRITVSGRGKKIEEDKQIKNKYFKEVVELLEKTKGKIIIAGPGFEKENFYNYLKEKHADIATRVFLKSTNNTGKQAVFELMKSGMLEEVEKQLRIIREVKAIEKLVEALPKDQAVYGFEKVKEALEYGAIEELLVIDSLVIKDPKVEELIEEARDYGTTIIMISEENEESEKLKALGGIAGILRFKLE